MNATLAARVATGGADDMAAVMQVMDEAFDAGFGEAWTQAQCLALMALPGAWLVVARTGEDAAGFALSRAAAGEAELMLIGVRPAHRSRGIGRALVEAVVAGARTRAAEAVHLEVRDGNPAVDLYLAAGFVEVGRRRDYYRGVDGRRFDARTFRLAL